MADTTNTSHLVGITSAMKPEDYDAQATKGFLAEVALASMADTNEHTTMEGQKTRQAIGELSDKPVRFPLPMWILMGLAGLAGLIFLICWLWGVVNFGNWCPNCGTTQHTVTHMRGISAHKCVYNANAVAKPRQTTVVRHVTVVRQQRVVYGACPKGTVLDRYENGSKICKRTVTRTRTQTCHDLGTCGGEATASNRSNPTATPSPVGTPVGEDRSNPTATPSAIGPEAGHPSEQPAENPGRSNPDAAPSANG